VDIKGKIVKSVDLLKRSSPNQFITKPSKRKISTAIMMNNPKKINIKPIMRKKPRDEGNKNVLFDKLHQALLIISPSKNSPQYLSHLLPNPLFLYYHPSPLCQLISSSFPKKS